MQLPAALSPLTRDLVTGVTRPARVVAAFPTALYLTLDEGDAARAVLPVVTADALLLPTALRLALPSRTVTWPVGPGDEVVIGGGVVVAPGLELRVVRQWRPDRVESGLAVPGSAALGRLPDGGVLGGLCSELAAAALTAEPAEAHVAGLVGAGIGLTPSGDDALCGVLLALRAWGPTTTAAAAVGEVVARSRHRTTDLSASLLLAAAGGYAVPQVVALIRALSLADSDPGPASASGASGSASVTAALEAVLAIGHSSGRDLVSGLVGTLHALTGPRGSLSPSTLHHSPSTPALSPTRVPSHSEGITRG